MVQRGLPCGGSPRRWALYSEGGLALSCGMACFCGAPGAGTASLVGQAVPGRGRRCSTVFGAYGQLGVRIVACTHAAAVFQCLLSRPFGATLSATGSKVAAHCVAGGVAAYALSCACTCLFSSFVPFACIRPPRPFTLPLVLSILLLPGAWCCHPQCDNGGSVLGNDVCCCVCCPCIARLSLASAQLGSSRSLKLHDVSKMSAFPLL